MSIVKELQMAYPIIQAPMAGVATPRLAAEVSNAGGLGGLGIAAVNNEKALALIRATQKLTNRPFNINVFCHQSPRQDFIQEQQWVQFLSPLFESFNTPLPNYLKDRYPSFKINPGVLKVLLQTRPKVVSFHFGLPSKKELTLLHRANIYTIATATSLEEALLIQESGVKAIVAQGYEAGGHRGIFNPYGPDEKLSTINLLNVLRPHIQLPLIAAGGIMNGQHIKKALAAGASAAQLGTAFVACTESAAGNTYRQHMKNATNTTQLTAAISGRPARAIVNDFIRYTNRNQNLYPPTFPLAYDVNKRLQEAAASQPTHAQVQSFDVGAYWAGTNVAMARHIPARQLVNLLVRELTTH